MGCSSYENSVVNKLMNNGDKTVLNIQISQTNQVKNGNEKFYTEEEINDLYKQFLEKENIVKTFLDIETEGDPVFNILKKKEKAMLANYFNSNSKNTFTKEFSNKITRKNYRYD